MRAQGVRAITRVTPRRAAADLSLLELQLLTGRTHQIRVHLAHLEYPIAGDDKYGDFAANRVLAKRGLKRMFLHACRLQFTHPASGEQMVIEAPLPPELADFLSHLEPVPAEGA